MRAGAVAAAMGAVAGLVAWLSFNTCARVVAWGYRGVERWRTWQAASPDQRARMRVEDERLGDDRFDLWDLRRD